MPRLRALLKSPPLAKGDAEQQLEELRDYLLQIVEELGYLLTHIEADNINDTTFERISQMIPKAFTGTPTMDGEGSPGTAPTWARGDHTHPKDSSKADVTALAAHIADRLNPHAVTKAQVGLGNVADERQYSAQNPPPVPSAEDVGAIPTTEKGSAGGVAELDSNGMVPSAQLPSYVDDVLEYASLSVFPVTGESGKIYVALDTNKTYRWSGSAYVEISESLALGETSSTAYRGDRGKAAYDHSQLTSGNPHNVTAAEAGAVPTSRKVNNKALSQDISLTASDVGARADTWMPSASDVGAQPTITASGILKGDGAGGVSAAVAGTDYQAPLTIDATPTANSTNPVQSGGVYTDVRTRVPVYGKGVNLLRNWYFVGGGTGRGVFPVNQRGQSSYDGFVYSIDNWQLENRYGQAITINSDGIQIIGTSSAYQGIQQYIDPSLFNGQKVTISALCTDGTLATASGIITITSSDRLILNSGGDLSVFLYGSTSLLGFHIRCLVGITKTIVAAKLELGTEQTLCHNEGTAEAPVWVLNEIPDYEYELYRCITSTADPSDTYANKSLATEQQLAYVENGTTASRNYSAGQYISLNGLLYTADTAIANGATFYTSGGNKNLTECVGGGFNNIIKAVTKSVTVESGSNHLVPLGIYKPYIPVAYDFPGYMFHTVNIWENQWYALCTNYNLNKYNSGTFTGTIYYI